MIKPSATYDENLWYPIVVKDCGVTRIIEMKGSVVNAWNREAHKLQLEQRRINPVCWI